MFNNLIQGLCDTYEVDLIWASRATERLDRFDTT